MRLVVRRLGALVLLAVGAGWLMIVPATAVYPQDPPNDPGYASAENDPTCSSKVQSYVGSEQYYLYSSMPRCAPAASDPENAPGMSIDKAWAQYSTGSPHTVIAYVEGGINWQRDAAELRDKVYLIAGELPLPLGSSKYDANGDGVFNVEDYANDPARS